MSGSIHGGQQPISGSALTVWAAGTSGYGAGAQSLATTTSGARGGFQFPAFTCPANNPPVYITAQGGNSGSGVNNNIMMAVAIGPCSGAAAQQGIQINEVTTVATAYAWSHFFTTTIGGTSTDAFGGTATAAEGNNQGLALAGTATVPTLVSIAGGVANTSNANITLESAKLNSLADIIATCINSAGNVNSADTTSPCGKLFTLTTPPYQGATKPADTLQAIVQIALYPYQNVSQLYNSYSAAAPFVGLATQPNDWTVAVGYKSAAFGLGIDGTATTGTSSTLDIDATGRVWFPTNSTTSHGLGYFDPNSNTFNGPFGTGLSHPQYVAIDSESQAFGTDTASNTIIGVKTGNGAQTTFYNTGAGTTTGAIAVSSNATTSVALMFAVNTATASTVYEEDANNFHVVSPTTYRVTGLAPYTLGSPDQYFEAEVASSGSGTPCALENPYVDSGSQSDQVIVASSSPCMSGGVAQVSQQTGASLIAASSLNQICNYGVSRNPSNCFAITATLNKPEGIAVDGDNNVWIANAGNGSISTIGYSNPQYVTTSTTPYLHGTNNGGTLTAPYGIGIDRSGNVWVTNAGCVSTTGTACTPGAFTLSELVGAAAPTLTPLFAQNLQTSPGTPTRPQTIVTGGGVKNSTSTHAGIQKARLQQ